MALPTHYGQFSEAADASEEIDLRAYLGRWKDLDRILNLTVGDLHRIIAYPSLGFPIPRRFLPTCRKR